MPSENTPGESIFSSADRVRGLSPYQPGKPVEELARTRGLDPGAIVKLASNENPLGMCDAARAAISAQATALARYPDGDGYLLKSALAGHYGVPAGGITLGNGSSDLLVFAAQAFLQAGSSAVYSQYAFTVYDSAVKMTGARGIVVPAKDFGHDLAAMLAAIGEDTRLVFIANPSNPTGTHIPADQLEAFLERVHANWGTRVMVVLDEAYDEYLAPALRSAAMGWLERFPNLIVLRTFSKAYGLAGLRVGFGVSHPEVAGMMNRVRPAFNVNTLAQAAAVAALGDAAFVQRVYEVNRQGREQLQRGLDSLGVPFLPGEGNFILLRAGDARRVNEALLERGVIVRPVGNYGLPEWLRVTIGLPAENERFLQALAAARATAPT